MADEKNVPDSAGLSAEELAAIRERAEKATPGPWYRRIPYAGDVGYVATKDTRYRGDRGGDYIGMTNSPGMSKRRDVFFTEVVADAEFITHARQDIPALLAENAALREIVEAVAHFDMVIEDYCPWCELDLPNHPDDPHKPYCPVTQARALLGMTDAQ